MEFPLTQNFQDFQIPPPSTTANDSSPTFLTQSAPPVFHLIAIRNRTESLKAVKLHIGMTRSQLVLHLRETFPGWIPDAANANHMVVHWDGPLHQQQAWYWRQTTIREENLEGILNVLRDRGSRDIISLGG
ncbi:MAG: hypothetical protein M1835_000604 [Candelina submexicana]|nr:MAG: hypothetical protein M1835_000604 [Candelina submexicana]